MHQWLKVPALKAEAMSLTRSAAHMMRPHRAAVVIQWSVQTQLLQCEISSEH